MRRLDHKASRSKFQLDLMLMVEGAVKSMGPTIDKVKGYSRTVEHGRWCEVSDKVLILLVR